MIMKFQNFKVEKNYLKTVLKLGEFAMIPGLPKTFSYVVKLFQNSTITKYPHVISHSNDPHPCTLVTFVALFQRTKVPHPHFYFCPRISLFYHEGFFNIK